MLNSEPVWIAFDGTKMWIANVESKSVTKLRASDGANLGTLFINDQPEGMAFDGANIWVTRGDFESLQGPGERLR